MSNNIPQTVEGIEYPTIRAVAKAYDLKENTLYKRYERGHEGTDLIPEKFRKSYKEPHSTKPLPFKVGSLRFKNVSDACRNLNVDRGKYNARIRNGWSPEEALEIVPRIDGRLSKVREPNPKISSRGSRRKNIYPLSVFGLQFKNYSELAKFTGEKASVLWQRVNVSNKSLEEAVVMEGKKKRIAVGDTEYDSYSDLAKSIGLEPNTFFSLLKKYSLDDLVNNRPRETKWSVYFGGKTYSSLKSLATEFGLGINELTYRLRCGLELEKALSISSGESVVQSLSNNLSTLYVAKICDEAYETVDDEEVYKIGVTQHMLQKRLSEFPFKSQVIFQRHGLISDLKPIEKMAKKLLSYKRFRSLSAKDFDGFTEVFSLNKPELERLGFLVKTGI